MKKSRIVLFGLLACTLNFLHCQEAKKESQEPPIIQDTQSMQTETKSTTSVVKKVLKNGMTILVRASHLIPKVSIQIWYNVGSKDEKTGERGIAHLIEHMIFKGTKNLSESDIDKVVRILSGVCNAFTSYDYTGYLFDMPTQNWKEVLPIIADCMTNASFKEDHLNSEMKAVIQELKMRRDNYTSSLASDMLTSIFPDHPYHYPIIGYKQDLWNVTAKELREFYNKHYLPNNAALVVTGDVDPEEVFKLAEKYFGALKPNVNYKKEQFYYNEDIGSKSVTLYRDVQQPILMLAYVVPGSRAKEDDLIEITSYLLGAGRTSRLYKKIVDELELALSLETYCWNLFDHSLLFIIVEPRAVSDIDTIKDTIDKEIKAIVAKGVDDKEVAQAIKQAQVKYYHLLENTESQAYEIGKYFWATGDENFAFKLYDQPIEGYKNGIKKLCATFLRSAVANKGVLLPLPNDEKKEWQRLQKLSDEIDKNILSPRVRNTPVEQAKYANAIKPHEAKPFAFPKHESFELSNGAKVLTYNNPTTPTIQITISLKAKHYYDPEKQAGLYNFVVNMLPEGTKNYTAIQLAEEFESRGMSFEATPGTISVSLLSQDLEKGLELIQEVLSNATFPIDRIEKVREQIISAIKNFWDNPNQFVNQVVREKIYGNHPYHKDLYGSTESIKKISQKELVEFYKKYISPQEAIISIVGDIQKYDLKSLLEKKLSAWKGPHVESIKFPAVSAVKSTEVNYPINRDQTVLCLAGISIDRKNPDYDKLLLFDQIFGGGVLGSMSSRLFELRQQSGLFYTISGSLLANASEQPGMVLIKTIVSLDRLAEAESAIKKTIETVLDTLTENDLELARQAIINSLVNNFESNKNAALAFIFLEKYNMPSDYFDTRSVQLKKITLAQIKDAVKKVLQNDKLITVKVGRES